jgi:Glucosyl transferase GtrII
MHSMCRSSAGTRRSWRGSSIFLATLGFYLLAILGPILLADRYCNDDLVRSLLGNYGWNNAGRQLANYLMRALQFGASRAIDISPLPQLIAIAILSWIALLLSNRFAIASIALAVLVAIPIGAQPFFLENLAYKFDAAAMAAAVLFALLPITSTRIDARGWLLGCLSLIASLNFYQPAFNIFLVFAVFEVMQSHVVDQDVGRSVRLLAFRGLQALIVAILYKFLFATTLKGWMGTHGTIIHSLGEMPKIPANVNDFFTYFVGSLGTTHAAFFGVLVAVQIGFLVSMCVTRAIQGRNARSFLETSYLLLFSVLLPFMAFMFVVGPMLFLEQPVFMPRVMVAVGALVSASLVSVHVVARDFVRIRRLATLFGAIWALWFAFIAAAFGNASADQRRYEDAIATQLANDLAELHANHGASSFTLRGTAGYSPMVERVSKQLPILQKLVSPYLLENDYNTRYFLMHYVTAIPQQSESEGAQQEDGTPRMNGCGKDALYVRDAYAIKMVGTAAVVQFSKGPKPICE